MRRLDDKTISSIKELMGGKPCPVFAIQLKTGAVVVTNGAAVFEWPETDVDYDSKKLSKLFDAQKDKRAAGALARLGGKTHWAKQLFRSRGTFVPLIECEPTEAELIQWRRTEAIDPQSTQQRAMVYRPRRARERIYYNYRMIELIESLVDVPVYSLFCVRSDGGPLRLMAVYDGKTLVGALANQLM